MNDFYIIREWDGTEAVVAAKRTVNWKGDYTSIRYSDGVIHTVLTQYFNSICVRHCTCSDMNPL